MIRGPWVTAARCGECGDGFAFSHAEKRWVAPTTNRPAYICRACGASDWQKAIGRKVYPWWRLFVPVPSRWEWRDADTRAAAPTMVTGAMRARLVALGFADAQINSMRPAEAWAVLREVDPEWYAQSGAGGRS